MITCLMWKPYLVLIVLLLMPLQGLHAQQAPRDTSAFAPFVEPGFPFITTTVEAGELGRTRLRLSVSLAVPLMRSFRW